MERAQVALEVHLREMELDFVVMEEVPLAVHEISSVSAPTARILSLSPYSRLLCRPTGHLDYGVARAVAPGGQW
eukprot:scaffold538_cov412-Prasinococcus_capsulatus_cf.AAC.4